MYVREAENAPYIEIQEDNKMNVLVINCGSSSLKFQLIDSESEKVLAKGLCERIGIDGSLTYQPAAERSEVGKSMPTPYRGDQVRDRRVDGFRDRCC